MLSVITDERSSCELTVLMADLIRGRMSLLSSWHAHEIMTLAALQCPQQ